MVWGLQRMCGAGWAGAGDAGTGSSVAMLTFFQSLNITLDPVTIQPAAASPATSLAACSHCSYAGPALDPLQPCVQPGLNINSHTTLVASLSNVERIFARSEV